MCIYTNKQTVNCFPASVNTGSIDVPARVNCIDVSYINLQSIGIDIIIDA